MAKRNTSDDLRFIQVNSKRQMANRNHPTDELADQESHIVEPTPGPSSGALQPQISGEAASGFHRNSEVQHTITKRKGKAVVSYKCIDESTNRNKKKRAGNIFIVNDQGSKIANDLRDAGPQNLEMVIPTERSGEVAIQMDTGNVEHVEPNILYCFLEAMYCLGLSTFDPGRKANEHVTARRILLRILHKIWFWTTVVFAVVYSLHLTKIHSLYFFDEQGIINFVTVGFSIVAVLAEIFTARLFAFLHGRMKRMLSALADLNVFEHGDSGHQNERWYKKKYVQVTALCGASFLMCMFKTATQKGIIGWTLKNMILRKSEAFSYGLFIWTTNDLVASQSKTAILDELYGTSLTAETGTMGFFGLAMAFCSNMKLEFTINLIIITGWCFKHFIAKLADKVQRIDFTQYTNRNDCAELNSPTGHWAEYKKLKVANKAMNVVFDGLLKIMHANNVMLCTDFLMHILENKVTTMEFLFLAYNIIKLAIAYRFAKQSHSYNAIFQQWIRDWALHSEDKMFLLKVPAILDEMTKEPLGLGTGDFIIGESFILKFVGMVSSIFMLQVDKSEGDDD